MQKMRKRNLTMSNLKQKYIKKVIPAMKKEFGYENDLAVPSIEKIVINTSSSQIARDDSFRKTVLKQLAQITGQKPVLCSARQSESAFEVRQGLDIGAKVTLRRKRMWNFLDKLINLTLPNIRDFEGIQKTSFDKKGNLTIGMEEQVPFPEIDSQEVEKMFGLEVCIKTTTSQRKKAIKLLKLLGLPLK